MHNTKQGGPSRIALILLALFLMGGVAAVTVLFQQNVKQFDTHDHDRDGTPDHGTEAHSRTLPQQGPKTM
jgi:hypothetical protein